jgi:hypothetical protein
MSKRHDVPNQAFSMTLLPAWCRRNTALAAVVSLSSLAQPAQAAPYVPFPSAEVIREVQLAALACARENTAISCDQARRLADPLMDHPRLPANCKDLIWQVIQKAQPATSNSFSRREAIADPAQRLPLVCRSADKPEAAAPPPGSKPGNSGINFSGSSR